VLVLLAGLVAGTVLAGFEKPHGPRKPHKTPDGRDIPDNTKVVKVFDAVEAVEEVLFTPGPVFGGMLLRAFTQILKSFFDIKHGHWEPMNELEKQADEIQEAIFGKVADAIEAKIREKALQQSNDRRTGIWLEGGAREGPAFTFKQTFGFGHNRNFRVRLGEMHTNAKEWDH
jgi:hypothetical protein